MNAPLTKEQLARLSANNVAYHGQYVEGLSLPLALPEKVGAVTGWLRAAVERLGTWRERRAVVNELSQLSDRDLADIGLSRTDLHAVFNPAFVRARQLSA